jgi:hypothetical protein
MSGPKLKRKAELEDTVSWFSFKRCYQALSTQVSTRGLTRALAESVFGWLLSGGFGSNKGLRLN